MNYLLSIVNNCIVRNTLYQNYKKDIKTKIYIIGFIIKLLYV